MHRRVLSNCFMFICDFYNGDVFQQRLELYRKGMAFALESIENSTNRE